MAMDIRKIKKLIELAKESGIAEIEIHEDGESVRISLAGSKVAPMMMQAPTYITEPQASAPAAAPAAKDRL
jgi:biotin carboxyl carrier protein